MSSTWFMRGKRRVVFGLMLATFIIVALISSVYWKRATAEPTVLKQNLIENTVAYTFWKDDLIYYSQNTETEVVTSSLDEASVINDALKASDGIFLLRGNNFTISKPLILDSNDHLVGSRNTTILFLASGTNSPVIYSDSENVTVSNLSINGNKAGQNGGVGLSGIRFSNVKNFNISNIHIQDTFHQGLDIVDSSHNGSISNVETFRTGAAGIYIGYQSYNLTIENAVLLESGYGFGGCGIDEDGLILAGETNGYCKNIMLNNIVAINASRHGISFWDCEQIIGNNLYAINNTIHGIYFVRGNHYINLKNTQANFNGKNGIVIRAGNQLFEEDAANHHLTVQGYSIGNGEDGVNLGGLLPQHSYPYPYDIDLSVNAFNNTRTGIVLAGYDAANRIEHVRIHDCKVTYNSQSGTGVFNGILLYQTKHTRLFNVEIGGMNQAWGIYESVGTGGYTAITNVNVFEGNVGGIKLNAITSKTVNSLNVTSWNID